MNKSSAITCAPSSNHFAWLDWMKVLALFSVIWGHFFSLGYQYHYVFNVQAFCVVSGFLYRQAPDWRSCLEKNIRQLLVPTVALSLLMQLEAVVRCWLMGTTYAVSWPWYFDCPSAFRVAQSPLAGRFPLLLTDPYVFLSSCPPLSALFPLADGTKKECQ